jgi:hypothetical protein
MSARVFDFKGIKEALNQRMGVHRSGRMYDPETKRFYDVPKNSQPDNEPSPLDAISLKGATSTLC